MIPEKQLKKEELYVPISGFDSLYYITNYGRVWSIPRNGTIKKGKWIKPSKRRKYLKYTLHKDNKPFFKSAHRLVAIAFIENPFNLLTVNHINGIHTDNHVSNLEWLSSIDNTRHAIKTGIINNIGIFNNNSKKWHAIKPDGTLYKNDLQTLKDFCLENNINYRTVSRNMKNCTAVSKRHKTLSGWRFYHD